MIEFNPSAPIAFAALGAEGLNSIMLRLNAHIVSNRRNWMLRLEEDNVGRHDMTFPLCDGRRYLDYYGLPDHPNCRDSLSTVLNDYGITYDKVPDFEDFGAGCVLLAGAEVLKLADAPKKNR